MISPRPNPLPARPSHLRQVGFTLLEILLALSMFSLLMSLLYLTMGQSMNLADRTEQQGDIYAMARTAILRIQEDLEAAPLLPPLKDTENNAAERHQFILTDHAEDGHDNDTLEFITMATVPIGNKHQLNPEGTLITYHTERTGELTLTLYRTSTPLGREEPPSPSNRAILCELLTGIDFKCADKDNQERSAWDSDADPKAGLPQRVTVTLRFRDPAVASGEIRFMTSFLLPVSANQ